MATRASRFTGPRRELAGVRVVVTGFACLGRAFEEYLRVAGKRFVTRAASNGAMGAAEREGGLGVIKSVNVDPRAGIVAGFTTKKCAVRAGPLHTSGEFTLVRIGVAGSAGAVGKSER